jgi:hypothetical protein
MFLLIDYVVEVDAVHTVVSSQMMQEKSGTHGRASYVLTKFSRNVCIFELKLASCKSVTC